MNKADIKRQDFVDNSIFDLIKQLAPPDTETEWSIEMIGVIRDTIENQLSAMLSISNMKKFYP